MMPESEFNLKKLAQAFVSRFWQTRTNIWEFPEHILLLGFVWSCSIHSVCGMPFCDTQHDRCWTTNARRNNIASGRSRISALSDKKSTHSKHSIHTCLSIEYISYSITVALIMTAVAVHAPVLCRIVAYRYCTVHSMSSIHFIIHTYVSDLHARDISLPIKAWPRTSLPGVGRSKLSSTTQTCTPQMHVTRALLCCQRR